MIKLIGKLVISLSQIRQNLFVFLPQKIFSNTLYAFWEATLITQSGFRTKRQNHQKQTHGQAYKTISYFLEDFDETNNALLKFALTLQNLCNKAGNEGLDGVTVYFLNSKQSRLSIKLMAIVLLMPMPVDFKNVLEIKKDDIHENDCVKLTKFEKQSGLKIKKFHKNNAREWIKNLGVEFKYIILNIDDISPALRLGFVKSLESFLFKNTNFKIINLGRKIDLSNQSQHQVVELSSRGIDYLEVLALCSEADIYIGSVGPEFGVAQYYNLYCFVYGNLPQELEKSSRSSELTIDKSYEDFSDFLNSAADLFN